jgi:sugar/nucleoside kinase (ribokinase family)
LLAEDLQGLDYQAVPVLHTSGVCLVEEPSRSSLLSALQYAKQAGCRIYYDPNLRLEGDIFPHELRCAQMEAISRSNVVLIGDEELQLLFDGASIQKSVELLFEAGPRLVVIKQGKQGATLFHESGKVECSAFAVPVVSLAGAGDAFDAGFIAASERKASLPDALRYACAVAAIKVTRPGARSVPRHTEVLAFLADQDRSHKVLD